MKKVLSLVAAKWDSKRKVVDLPQEHRTPGLYNAGGNQFYCMLPAIEQDCFPDVGEAEIDGQNQRVTLFNVHLTGELRWGVPVGGASLFHPADSKAVKHFGIRGLSREEV